jgi:hypothetical protein
MIRRCVSTSSRVCFFCIPRYKSHFLFLLALLALTIFAGTDTATGQNVALLTRIDLSRPMSRSEARVQYPVPGSACGFRGQQGRKVGGKAESSGVSKHFLAQFALSNPLCHQASSSSCSVHTLEISLIAAHLVSKPTDPRACSQREAQATGVFFLSRLIDVHLLTSLAVIRDIVRSELQVGPARGDPVLHHKQPGTWLMRIISHHAFYAGRTARDRCW